MLVPEILETLGSNQANGWERAAYVSLLPIASVQDRQGCLTVHNAPTRGFIYVHQPRVDTSIKCITKMLQTAKQLAPLIVAPSANGHTNISVADASALLSPDAAGRLTATLVGFLLNLCPCCTAKETVLARSSVAATEGFIATDQIILRLCAYVD